MLTTIVLAAALSGFVPFHFWKVKKLQNRVKDLNSENRSLTEVLVSEKPRKVKAARPIKGLLNSVPVKEILRVKGLFDSIYQEMISPQIGQRWIFEFKTTIATAQHLNCVLLTEIVAIDKFYARVKTIPLSDFLQRKRKE